LGEGLKPLPAKQPCLETLTCRVLPLETKQSGGKLLPHSDLQGGVSKGGMTQNTKGDEVRHLVDGWIILGWISRRWDVVIWTRLVWRTLVSAVMKLRVP